MTIENGDVMRVTMRYNIAGGVGAENVYYAVWNSIVPIADSVGLTHCTDWMASIHNEFEFFCDTNVTLGVCAVDLVGLEGVYNPDPELNTSKVVVLRNVGTITPDFTPVNNSQQNPAAVAGSITAFTGFPKIKGRKSITGTTIAGIVEGVFNSGTLARLAAMTVKWLAGAPGVTFMVPGILSHKMGEFVEFNGTGSATNNPGSSDRRKIGVGS